MSNAIFPNSQLATQLTTHNNCTAGLSKFLAGETRAVLPTKQEDLSLRHFQLKIDVCTGKEVYERGLCKRPISGSFVDEIGNAQASEHRVLSHEKRRIYVGKYLGKRPIKETYFRLFCRQNRQRMRIRASNRQYMRIGASIGLFSYCHVKRDPSL